MRKLKKPINKPDKGTTAPPPGAVKIQDYRFYKELKKINPQPQKKKK